MIIAIGLAGLAPGSDTARAVGLTNESTGQASYPSGRPLTLAEALDRALARNHTLRIARLEIEARTAAAEQAGTLPNPRIELEAEDLAGSGEFNVASQPQTTIWLSQLVELGGKRAARLRSADLGGEVATLDLEVSRRAVLFDVSRTFAAALASQEIVALANDALRLAERTVGIVEERVDAGDVPRAELTRARIDLATARLNRDRRARELEAARVDLARTWGESAPDFGELTGDLAATPPLPTLQSLEARLAESPALRRWTALAAEGRARLELEVAQAVPDITLSAGYRRFYDTENNALVAGAAISLPIFDRNQGGIAEARARLAQAEEAGRAARALSESALRDAYRDLVAARREVLAFDQEIRPEAERAYAVVAEGYRLGKFGLSDLLDAQRTLFVHRIEQAQARLRLHETLARVEQIVGGPLMSVELAGNPARRGVEARAK